MMLRLFLLFIVSFTFFACEPESQVDYVKLQIPAELAGNEAAVEYLQKDARQLNRFFNSLDDLATDVEKIMIIAAKVDTTDQRAVEEMKPKMRAAVAKFNRDFGRLNLNIMWYVGKDLLSKEAKTTGILEEIPSEEGKRAFRKSMEHLQIQQDSLEERGKAFLDRMEPLMREHDSSTDD